MRRGQVAAQAFMFILGIVIFSAVLLYGYRAIAQISGAQEDIVLVKFQDQLTSEIDRVALKPGSVKKVDINLPTKYSQVCFLEFERFLEDQDALNALRSEHPLISRSVETGSRQNVFFTPLQETKMYIDNLLIGEDDGYVCMENKGGPIALRLRGVGGKVELSGWN